MTETENANVPPVAHGAVEGSASRASHGWFWLLMLPVLAGTAAAGYHYRDRWLPSETKEPRAKLEKRPLPVTTTTARVEDVDLFINSLGTATAFNTVTVRSRVEGELIKVAFHEGQTVREGDLLAEIDPRPYQVRLEQAEGRLAQNQAMLDNARRELERAKTLLASRSVSSQELDTRQTTVKQLEGAVQTDLAAVNDAKLQLGYCRIVAPIGGRLGLRIVDQGNIVRANDPNGLAVITQLQPIAVLFTIPQDDIPRVVRHDDSTQPLEVEAYNRDFQTRLSRGTLLATENQVDAATGTLRLKGVFENKDGVLFPNQFVNVRLRVETRHAAVVIPASTVQRGPDKTFVYVVKPDRTLEVRSVRTGPTEGGRTIIEQGLAANDVVVADGFDKLQPGAMIELRTNRKAAGVAVAQTAEGSAPRGP